MGKHRKIKKKIGIAVIGILLLVYFLWGRAWSRRWFVNYEQFLHRICPDEDEYHVSSSNMFNFPEELPASAESVRYHYYDKGFLDKKFGVSFTLNREEYQEMKEDSLDLFKKREENMLMGWHEYGEKVTSEFLVSEELDDLQHLFHDKEDTYTVLAYSIWPSAHTSYYISGIICSDEMNEMIFFYFFDAGRNEKRDTRL